MKTILITGINGFLGSSLALSLRNSYNIIGLEYTDNLHRIKKYNFKVYVQNKDCSVEDIFKENNVDIIIHAATIYGRNKNNISELLKTNVLLPVNLYELAGKCRVSLFINTDSFMNQANMISYLEEYVISKRQSLEWLKILNIENNCKLSNLVIYHQYGLNDSPDKFVPDLIKSLTENQQELRLTKGEQTRDFIYIEDVTNAFRCVANSVDILEQFSQFEVGTGISVSIREFVECAKKASNSNTRLNFGAIPYRGNEIMHSKANNENLIALGWGPHYSLEDGIIKLING